MKKNYILFLLFVAVGVKCFAQADCPATKQQRIDAAKAFIEKGAELNQYSVKDFLQACGDVFYPEQYSNNLKKRADNGDLKAMRDVAYYQAMTCSTYKYEELQKTANLIHAYFVFLSESPNLYNDEASNRIARTMTVIYYTLLEEAIGYDEMVNLWSTQFHLAQGNIPVSNCYARALINAFFKSNNAKGDYFTIGNRLLLRNTKENDDIISTIMMIKVCQYQASKSNSDSWMSTINGYKKILSELTDGQITDVPCIESKGNGKFIL